MNILLHLYSQNATKLLSKFNFDWFIRNMLSLQIQFSISHNKHKTLFNIFIYSILPFHKNII